jgi:hypothetical protein
MYLYEIKFYQDYAERLYDCTDAADLKLKNHYAIPSCSEYGVMNFYG